MSGLIFEEGEGVTTGNHGDDVVPVLNERFGEQEWSIPTPPPGDNTGSIYNFTQPFDLFWWSFGDGIDAVLDDVFVCEDSLTATEIQEDYNRQPWS